MHRVRLMAVILVGAALAPARAPRQRSLSLGAPAATYPEPFALLRPVRELSDGSVLVADPLGKVLVRVNPAFTRGDTLGKEGQGPQEYKQPDIVFPLAGDTSLLMDLGNARLTQLLPDGRFGTTVPMTRGVGPGGMVMMLASATDSRGGIYYQGSAMGGGPGSAPRDSVEIMRFDPAGDKVDTLAKVKVPEVKVTRTGGGGDNVGVRAAQVPLSPADGWTAAPSGVVFVARAADYHIEVRRPGAGWRAGPAVPYRPVSIGADEKEEWQEDAARSGGIGVSVQAVNGQMTVRFARGGGRGQRSNTANLEWPKVKPPFDPASLRVDPAGRLWVRRLLPAGRPAQYDVFDGEGKLVTSVTFPAGRTVVGFGSRGLYAAHVDENDLQTLERYRMPL